jgi:hypothetical protein
MTSLIQIYAGRQALEHIRNHGFKAQDTRMILGASGGPKWFVLSHLDRYLVQHWLPGIDHQIELVGSSIGAWRMSAYASRDPLKAINQLEHHYLNQRYSDSPTAAEVSKSVIELLDNFIDIDDVDHHHKRKLHVIAARTKGPGRFEHKAIQTLAFTGVAVGNIISRRSLPIWFDRVVFQSSGGQLPIHRWDQFKTSTVELSRQNYRDALLASGAIPVVIEGIRNPAGAPTGMYRDGGMVDYHFDLPFMPQDGFVLYPHFAPLLKPGWFDKALSWRKVQATNYDRTIVVCPSQAFVDSLPYGKIPDRKDFERMETDSRIQYWNEVVDRNQSLADAFDHWVNSNDQATSVLPIEHLAR